MRVKTAIAEAHQQVDLHDSKAAYNERLAINALCNLYGCAIVEHYWTQLESIVTSQKSVGHILSVAISTLKRLG